MTIKLPANLRQALLAWPGGTALATDVNHETAIIVKADASDLHSARRPGVAVAFQPQLAIYDEGPVFRLYLEIRDRPGQPLSFETFLNPAEQMDYRLLRKLAGQDHLDLHLFDMRLAYLYTKRIAIRPITRNELSAMIDQALAHLETIPSHQRNFPKARDAMMADTEI